MAIYTITLEDKVSAPAQQASVAVRGLADAMRGLAASMGVAQQAAQGIAPSIGAVGGAVGQTGAQLTTTSPAMAAMPPQLLAIKEAAEVTWGAISRVGDAVYELGLKAIGFADLRARTLATFNALTDGAGGETLDALKHLSEQLPYSGAQINDWGKQLLAAGTKSDQVAGRVRAVASAMAIMGEEGAQSATNLFSKLQIAAETGAAVKFDRRFFNDLRRAGIEVDDVAKRLGTTPDKLKTVGVSAAKLGEVIQASLTEKGKDALSVVRNSLEGIQTELSKGIGLKELFSDLGPAIKPFMTELRSLASEFFKGSTAANATKSVVTSVFTTLFDWATRATRALHIGFLTVAIFALQAAIAVAPVINAIRRFVAEHVRVSLLITALKGVAVVLGVIAVAVLVAISPFIIAGAIITAVAAVIVFALGWIVEHIGAAASAIAGFAGRAYAAASEFISGLVDGIKAGVGRVVEAAADLARGAIAAVRGALDSHSPSRVMMSVGVDTAQGMAQGIESGTNEVARASTEMGRSAIGSGAAGASSGRAGGGGTYNLRAELVIHNYSGDPLEQTEEAFAAMLDRLARQAGLAPEIGAPA